MIVVLRPNVSEPEIAEVIDELGRRGCTARAVKSDGRSVVHIVSGSTRAARRLLRLEQVEAIVPTSGPRVRRVGRRFYPYHFVNWSAFGVAALGLLVFLAGQFPPGLGVDVDYRHPPSAVDQPWYLRAPSAFIELFPESLSWLAWTLIVIAPLGLLFLPIFDRSKSDAKSGRWVRFFFAAAFVALVVFASTRGGAA